MSISRDGLLPKIFQKVHPKFQTPSFATLLTGFVVGVPILFTDKTFVLDFTSIATLFAFVLVCGGVLLIPRRAKGSAEGFIMPYINGKYLFALIVIGAMTLFAIFTPGYFGELFDFSNIDRNVTWQISTIVFWVACLLLAYFSFVKEWSLIPLMGLVTCMYLLTGMTLSNWLWFGSWLLLGLILYFSYGYKHSKLAK
jgi:basic amino acid/polyamine antiporter, APA family